MTEPRCRRLRIVTVVALCAGLAAGAAAQGSAATDRVALEALYDVTGGPGWTDNTHWKTDAPLDQWYGVETNGSRVSTLRLDGYDETVRRHVGNELAGSLPAELGTLTCGSVADATIDVAAFIIRVTRARRRAATSPSPRSST